MKYNFIDIGTSDFNTSAFYLEKDPSLTVMLVEPLTFYLDRLPNHANITKVNVAISNTNGSSDIYFLSIADIVKYDLEQCTRGCNKIGIPHISIEYELDRRNLPRDLIKKRLVKTITFQELCKQYDIEFIDTLKIDTEGHEEYIMPGVLETIQQGLIINQIQFENQEHLGNKKFLDSLVLEFINLGYQLSYLGADVVLKKINLAIV